MKIFIMVVLAMCMGCVSPRVIETNLDNKYVIPAKRGDMISLDDPARYMFVITDIEGERTLEVDREVYDIKQIGDRVMYVKVWEFRKHIPRVEVK